MKVTSAALFRASNLRRMDYPFTAALASALAICDEAVVVVGQSEDDTLGFVQQAALPYGGRVTIEQTTFVFDRGWQERWWQQATGLTDAEWLLWLDADEVIHPRQAPAIQRLMQEPGVRLIRFPFIHLYGTARWYVARGWLTHNTRLGRRSAGYRMVNLRHDRNPGAAACAVMVSEDGLERDAHQPTCRGLVTVEDIPVVHYGWCRHAQALAISQAKHFAWYANGDGLADGHIPSVAPHDFAMLERLRTGMIAPYTGNHAPAMQAWLDAHIAAWQQLEQVPA